MKEKNFKFLGNIDLTELKKEILEVKELFWKDISTRQNIFEAHCNTETIPLLWDINTLNTINMGEKTKYYDFFGGDKIIKKLNKKLHLSYGKGKIIKMILTKLKSKSEIYSHVDEGPQFELSHRIHIPIITNQDVIFTVNDEKKVMNENEMWEINNLKVHSVINNSSIDRIHLIVDYCRLSINYT